MKKKITLIIAILISFAILHGCTRSSKSEDTVLVPKNGPVTQEEALEIAKRLSGHIASSDMKFYEMRDREVVPPLSSCYLFEMNLDANYPDETVIVNDPKAPGGKKRINKPGEQMKAYIWVEADTGRILKYQTSSGYLEERNANRPMVSESDFISRDDAIKIAEQIMRITNIDMRNMSLTIDELLRYEINKTNIYIFYWARFKEIEGVGSVEMPEMLAMSLDAETGEMIDLSYINHDVDADIHPPLISKEEAIETAAEECKPIGKYEVEAHLCVCLTPNAGPDDNKTELSWKVVFDEEELVRPRCAIINADTGKLIDAERRGVVKLKNKK